MIEKILKVKGMIALHNLIKHLFGQILRSIPKNKTLKE